MKKPVPTLLVALFVFAASSAIALFPIMQERGYVLGDDDYSNSGSDDYDEEEDDEEDEDESEDEDEDEDDNNSSTGEGYSKSGSSKSSKTSATTKNSSASTTGTAAQPATAVDNDDDSADAYDGTDAYGSDDAQEQSDAYDAYDAYGNAESEGQSQEVVQNADGTRTMIYRKTEGSEVRVREITYDAAGHRLSDKRTEINTASGKEEIEVASYDLYGKKLTEAKLKIENGAEIEIKNEGANKEESHIAYDPQGRVLSVHVEDRNGVSSTLKIRAAGDLFALTRSGASAASQFPMTIDNETGIIAVTTPAGAVELKAMPDTIVEKVQNADGLDIIENVMLATEEKKVRYVVTGAKAEKLLGVFSVAIPSALQFDVTTGAFVANDQPFFSRLLDLFSF